MPDLHHACDYCRTQKSEPYVCERQQKRVKTGDKYKSDTNKCRAMAP